MVDIDMVKRICAETRRFSMQANWKWVALPVMQWEFADIGQFAIARMQLLQALEPHMLAMQSPSDWQRTDGPDRFEIDCYGVTFRLVCRQRIATPGGKTVGAAEVFIAKYGDAAYTDRTLKSPAEMEKIDATAKALVHEHAFTPTSDLTLALIDDKRPAVKIVPATEVFADAVAKLENA